MTLKHKSLRQIHPGEVLREDVLPALDIGKAAFARALGISRQHLYGILSEERPVSPEIAVRLGKVCGNGPRLWLKLQTAYDLMKAEQDVDVSELPTLVAAE